MTRLARKTCPRCGHECLEPELQCWACGELFAPRTIVPAAGHRAPTLVGYAAPRSAARGRWLAWVAVALGTLVAGVGLHLTAFWYQSEAKTPDTITLQPLPATEEYLPRPEPQPGPALGIDPGVGGAPPSAPIATPPRPPRTNRRGLPGSVAHDGMPVPEPRPSRDAALPPASPPRTAVPSPRHPNPSAAMPTPAPPPSAAPAAPLSGSGETLVAVRNDTALALDFDFGPNNFSGTVAPHSQITVPLSGGEYDLALRSSARKDTLYDVRVERGHRYVVAFTGRNTRVSPE